MSMRLVVVGFLSFDERDSTLLALVEALDSLTLILFT